MQEKREPGEDSMLPPATPPGGTRVNVSELTTAIAERLDVKGIDDKVRKYNKRDGLGTGDALHNRRKFLAGTVAALTSLGVAGGVPTAFAAAVTNQRRNAARGTRNTIFYSATNIADPYYDLGVAGMKAGADLFGLKSQLTGPPTVDYAAQTQDFQTILANPATLGILSSFQDPHAAAPLYRDAYAKHIPVADVGGGSWGMPRLTIAFYAVSATPIAAANMIISALGPKGGRVGYISNLLNYDLQEGQKIFAQTVKAAKNITYVGYASHNGTAQDAIAKYTSFCVANKPDAMWFGDGLGPSIVTGLLNAAPNVKLALRGLGPSGLKAIQQGKVLGTADRSEYEEELWPAIALALAAIHHYNAPLEFELNIYTITKANVAQMLSDPGNFGATQYI